MELEAKLWIGAKITWLTENNMFTTEIKTQAQNELNVVSHRGQCWDPYYLLYTQMTFRTV